MTASVSPLDPIRRAAFRLSRPDILFWTLPLLMILLIAGTVAQKELGLHVAQQRYFSSWIVWFGPVPFPGGYTLIGIFFVNLLMKFLLFSEWAWRKAGIIVTHFGALLLILGALFTATTEEDGYLVIAQGATASTVEDYHQRELRILKDGTPVLSRSHQSLSAGQVIQSPDLPFKLQIDTYCYNCAISERSEDQQEGWTTPGKFMQLSAQKPATEDEQNMTGIEFSLNGQKYLTFDKFPKPPVISVDDHEYTVIIGRSERPLPFTLTLNKFQRDLHPGTETASFYRSDLTVTDGDKSWPAVITMNEPLRYRGYTFYQSSFDLSGDTPFTVLSVVRNTGRIFPYVSSIIMALGLLIHLVLRLRRRGDVT